MHRGCRRFAGFSDARDDRARGAHLGGAEEQVRIDGERERDLRQCFVGGDARRLEGTQVGGERRGEIGELLRLAGAGLVRHRGIDHKGDDVGAGRARLARKLRRIAERILDWHARGAQARERADGVDIEERAGLTRLRLEQFERAEEMPRRLDTSEPAPQLNRGIIKIDTGERCGHVVGAGDDDAGLARARDLQHDARGAAFELLQDHLVGGAGIGCHDALVDMPAEAFRLDLRPAREGRGSRNRRRGGGQGIGARIKRIDVQPVRGPGHELAVEIGTLQRLFDELAPGLVVCRLEAAGERDRRTHVRHCSRLPNSRFPRSSVSIIGRSAFARQILMLASFRLASLQALASDKPPLQLPFA